MLVYKFDVFKELKEKYSNNVLSQNFSGSTLQKLRNGVIVDTKNISNICKLLNKQPGSIIKWVPDGK